MIMMITKMLRQWDELSCPETDGYSSGGVSEISMTIIQLTFIAGDLYGITLNV
jgi:hypothetical protein